jgi:P-type Cu2+ transporter
MIMHNHNSDATEKHHCHHTKEKPNNGHKKHSEHQGHCEGHCGSIGGTHNTHHIMMIQDFEKRFWISLIITLPILTLSPMIQGLLHFHLSIPGNTYILFLLSTIVYLYGGWPFTKGLYEECKNKNPGMMTLIGIAISVAYFYSAAVVFGLAGGEFFWELVTLIDIMLLGHWIEMKSVLGASRSLEFLVEMLPQTAHLVKDNEIIDVKLDTIQVNTIVLVKPGEKVPTDGKIIEGSSYLNESMLTGESKPVKKEIGDRVIGGSINGNGSLKIQVQHTGKDSYLSKVIKLVQEAQETKSKTQGLVDRAARWLTFIAIGVGLITFIIWIVLGKEMAFALERMVTVMVICCPHALGLAVPLVVAISTTLSAQHGLLIRNRTSFENSRKITTLVFDKTGTLTKGGFNVVRYESLNQTYSKSDALKIAASLEQNSEHPIATGIVKAARQKNIALETIKNFQALTGQGITAQINGKNAKVVSPKYLIENKINFDNKHLDNIAETVVIVLVNEEVVGFISLADEIRDESYTAIQIFKKNNIKTIMLTGDNKEVAKTVSDKLEIDDFYAEVLPHQKLDIIKKLQNKGEFVAMTGDGVNDAPALAQADIGIAIGSGTDVAAETADIILVESNPKDIAALILFGKATYRKMVQNLAWATGYNVVSIPLAAGVLYHYGVILSPAVGAVLMSISTIVVAFNAQLLKKQIFTT